MTRIYLVRHGETEWNARGKYLGLTDLPLTLTGQFQARALSKFLADKEVEAAYSSELQRTRETLEIATAGIKIKKTALKDLNEIDFGRWEGMTYEEIESEYGDLISNWLNDITRFDIPGGERWNDFKSRVTQAFNGIIEENPGREVLVVAHGGVIKAFIGSTMGMDPISFWRLRQDKGALNILEFHGGQATITLMNDTCYQRID